MCNYTCPVCGGTIIGDGYTSPAHCENSELPDYVEADSGPYYCTPETNPEFFADGNSYHEHNESVTDEEYYANMPLEPTGNGVIYGDGDDIPF